MADITIHGVGLGLATLLLVLCVVLIVALSLTLAILVDVWYKSQLKELDSALQDLNKYNHVPKWRAKESDSKPS